MEEPEGACGLASGLQCWGLLGGLPPPASEEGARRGVGGRERGWRWGPHSEGGRTSMRLSGVWGLAGSAVSPEEGGSLRVGADRGRGRLRGEGGREKGVNRSGLLVLRIPGPDWRSAVEVGVGGPGWPRSLESRATCSDSKLGPSSPWFTSGGPPGPPGPSPGWGRAGDLGRPQSSPSAREALPSARTQPRRSSSVSAAST